MKQLRILVTMLFLSFLTVGFIACETEGDICNKTNKCLNGGVYIDGDCHCPRRYYGDECQYSIDVHQQDETLPLSEDKYDKKSI